MLKAEARAIHDIGTAARKIGTALERAGTSPELLERLRAAIEEAVAEAKALKAREGVSDAE